MLLLSVSKSYSQLRMTIAGYEWTPANRPGPCVCREKETGRLQERRHWSDELIVPVNISASYMWPWHECVHCKCVCVCSRMASLEQCSVWLWCHSSPLMKWMRWGGRAWWRRRWVIPAKSSTQDDGKAMGLSNGHELVNCAFVNHQPPCLLSITTSLRGPTIRRYSWKLRQALKIVEFTATTDWYAQNHRIPVENVLYFKTFSSGWVFSSWGNYKAIILKMNLKQLLLL